MKYYFLALGAIFMMACGVFAGQKNLYSEIWFAMLTIICMDAAISARKD